MPRESTFTQEIADKICDLIAEGQSLRFICSQEGMPNKGTVLRWLADDERKAFRDQYTRAREAQADALFEEILEIADESENDTFTDENGNERTNHEVVARSRLRVDARKWMAGKLRPKVYGDKLDLTSSDGSMSPRGAKELTDDELARIAAGGSPGAADQA